MLRFRGWPSVASRVNVPRAMLNMQSTQHLFPSDAILEENRNSDYDQNDFTPLDRAKHSTEGINSFRKLGWGGNSTVWLARDTKRCADA